MRIFYAILLGLVPMILETECSWEKIDCFPRENQTVCFTVDYNGTELTRAEAAAECGRRHHNGRLGVSINEQIMIMLWHMVNHGSYWFGPRLTRLHQWTWIDGSADVSWFSINNSSFRTHVKITVTDDGYQARIIYPFDYGTIGELALCQVCSSGVACYYVGAANGWLAARDWCLTRGGDLAVLSNSTYQALRRNRVLLPGNTYYLGLRNAIFDWQGTSDEVIKTAHWEPELRDSFWDGILLESLRFRIDLFDGCMLMDSHRPFFVYGQMFHNCSQRHKFICEYVEDQSTTSTITTTSMVMSMAEDKGLEEPGHQLANPVVIGLAVLSTCLFVILVIIVGLQLYNHRKKNKRTAQQTERYEQIAVGNQTATDNTLMYEPIRVVDNTTYANVSPKHS